MTSAWGRYWLDHVLRTSRPTHLITGFGINDLNSVANVSVNRPSAYDFDPDNMWAAKSSAAGGVFGSVTEDEWLANSQAISDRAIAAGVRVINLLPPVTASGAQYQGLIFKLLSRRFGGQEPLFDMSGRK